MDSMILISIIERNFGMNELKTLLINVPDSYYDFVTGIMAVARKSKDNENQILKYLQDNPAALSSDVVLYVSDHVLKVKRINIEATA